MEFRRKVHVVVLTIPKVNEASLNEEVLAYARHHGTGASKWISQSNPNHWADGILILAVAPDSRKVGCYFGDDVKVSLSQQEMIIAAGGDRFSEADWYGDDLHGGDVLRPDWEASWRPIDEDRDPGCVVSVWSGVVRLLHATRARGSPFCEGGAAQLLEHDPRL